jgi:8-oxo-dGTP pyrophosphatase MutT (NUDIX family)
MDLSIQLENVKLNIRVAVLIKTNKGYLFEKGKDDYLFALGGRVKVNESSLQAAQREVLEEIGYTLKPDVKLMAVVENFFNTATSAVHEICFVYNQEEVVEIDLPDNFVQVQESDLAQEDIRPEIIKKIIMEVRGGISHYVIK